MADPTGLVSLGLGVVKKAVKHGSTMRSRQRHLEELPYAIDMASAILRDAELSDDPVTRAAHEEVLGPCIYEARQFLRRVENRKWFAATIKMVWSASDDDEESKRLLAELNQAPERIRARVLELRVPQLLVEIRALLKEQQSGNKPVNTGVSQSWCITIVSMSFFG